MEQILVRKEGRAGLIAIHREKALNAINFEMCLAIKSALDQWRNDPAVSLVVIEGQGERAFSAGGDIEELYRAYRGGDRDFSRRLWRKEYPFLASIGGYPKPYVALMDGYVMGLGAGVSMHASQRVVTERTVFAMPECSIGHLPDTGVSALFARSPGFVGKYLGMTGARIGAADAIYAGLADRYVGAERLGELKQALIDSGEVAVIGELAADPPVGELNARQSQIDHHFGKPSAVEIVQSLEAAGDDWSAAAAVAIRRASPLAIACFNQVMDRVSLDPTVENAVRWEFRYGYRSLSDGDFMEGVRAQIIDKDRQPKWPVAALEQLLPEHVERMLAPLGEHELQLR